MRTHHVCRTQGLLVSLSVLIRSMMSENQCVVVYLILVYLISVYLIFVYLILVD